MNRSPQHKAVADPATLVLVGLIALGVGVFGGTWKPLEIFRPKPPTEELTKLQGQLAEAQKAAETARNEKEAAIKAERGKLESQVRLAQQDNVGTVASLAKVPSASQTPEVKLAQRMAIRVDLKLAAAIGKLPEADREAMVELVEQALSGKQAEIDEANRKLAQKDAEFATLTTERDQIKAQIPVLTQKAVKAEETAKVIGEEKAKVENKVKVIASQLDAEKREKGSLGGALNSAKNTVIGAVVILVILGGVALYLRYGLGSVGRALHPLQQVLSADDYAKVVSTLDGETDKLHQWLIASGRKAEAKIAEKAKEVAGKL